MRIGIFGGTFNPIHYGHLINAEIVRTEHSLDRIIFIPSKMPVHKKLAGMTSSEDRLNMIRLALDSSNNMEVSSIEIDMDTPSYTITTIEELKKKSTQTEYYLIIGWDSFNEINTWKDYKKLIKTVPIIVMNRKGKTIDREKLINSSLNIIFADNPVIEISSTCIRERISSGETIKYLLPDKVIEYINEMGLYTN